jgi:TatD DNase family protein
VIDAHCHLAELADRDALRRLPRDAIILAVTNSPAEFARMRKVALPQRVRLAVGLHPALAERFEARDTDAFSRATATTSYVGEVGLDFSRPKTTWAPQETLFRQAIGHSAHKVLSIHSRRAEARVHELLQEREHWTAILHWYTGSLSRAERLAQSGCLFSIGPSMINTKHGQRLIDRIDPERLLVETDAPFARVKGRAASPDDMSFVYEYLAIAWAVRIPDAILRVRQNFLGLTQRALDAAQG